MNEQEIATILEASRFTMDAEHLINDEPSEIALLHRTFPTYTETMWIVGYPRLRMIVLTCHEVTIPPTEDCPLGIEMPGVVKEIPVGHRDMASAETFGAKFHKVIGTYLNQGWVCKSVSAHTDEAQS